MTRGGTRPGRKPGILTCFATSRYALSRLALSSANGTSMVSLTRVGLSSSTSVFTAASLPGRLCLPAAVASARTSRADGPAAATAAKSMAARCPGRPPTGRPGRRGHYPPGRPGPAGSGSDLRQGITLGSCLLRLAGQPAHQPDDDDGDGGADRRAGEVDPPAGEVGADDVGPERTGRVHRGAADRAGEQPQQRHRGSDRDRGVVADG